MKKIISLLAALALTLSAAPPVLAQGAGEAAQTTPAPESEGDTAFFAVPAWPVLETVGEYSEGMVRVTDGTLWGYAGAGGALVIQPQFDAAEDFFLGAALVTRNGKTGLLHWNGAFLLEPVYDELTAVNYGIYLGRRGDVWDLLSITPISTAEGPSHQLYADQAAATLLLDLVQQQVVLRDQEGGLTLLLVGSFPQLLQNRRAPGWQFPLSATRKASFQDVSGGDWFHRWVNLAYSVGMMEGAGGPFFEPLRTLTVAEALHLAACLESRARQDDFHLQSVSGPQWYNSSVVYCEASGVIARGAFGTDDLTRPVTRSEMARIFAATTPVRGIGHINSLAQVRQSIPDVAAGDPAADAIYGLYAKGILNGTDSALSFRPEDSLTRAEAAAIVSRIARPEQRITLWQ